MKTETQDDTSRNALDPSAREHPALLVVWSAEGPQHRVMPLVDGAVEVGRDELAAAGLPDGRMSRRHLRVEIEGDRWTVRDLGSRNGTFVDGRQVQVAKNLASPVVRIGRTVILPIGDHRPHESPGLTVRGGVVMGPALSLLHERIALVGRSGSSLLIHGPSGAGKELAAAAFHAAGQRDRPFVAVNCATIQKELAERILFGARRGAFTGAVADTVGLVQAADGGTLFLDEIAELEAGVQAKLLRVLETRTVTPIGATAPAAVSFRLCAATHKDLRAEVAEGRFREDLYFRIGRPHVRLPALRERREEIPWLIQRALSSYPKEGTPVVASAELVEACLSRPWPGNVRELLAEVRTAAIAAIADRRATVAASDLDEGAGRPIDPASGDGDGDDGGDDGDDGERDGARKSGRPEPVSVSGADIEAALRAEQGNVARAAARLGVARSRVRRFIEREGIDVRALRSG